jgi:hypothetical protein
LTTKKIVLYTINLLYLIRTITRFRLYPFNDRPIVLFIKTNGCKSKRFINYGL